MRKYVKVFEEHSGESDHIKFNKFAASLERAKIPCNVKQSSDGSIAVELGEDTASSVDEKVLHEAKNLGIHYNDVTICSVYVDADCVRSKKVHGGPVNSKPIIS